MEVSTAYADTAGYTAPNHCGVRAIRQISLIAARPVWSPHVSYRHGGKPVVIDTTQHDEQVRKRMGLMSREQEIESRGRIGHDVDTDAYRQVIKERRAKRDEARRRKVDLNRLNMPTKKDYLKKWELPKERQAAVKEKVIRTYKKKLAQAGLA